MRDPHVVLVSHRVVRTEGQGRVNSEIVKQAVARGMHVTIVSEIVSQEILELPNVDWIPVETGSAPTQLLKSFVFAAKTTSWLRKNRDRFDVVHVDGFVTFARSDINVVHYVHSEWLRSRSLWVEGFKSFRGLYQLIFTIINAFLERGAFRRTQIAIAVSRMVMEELARLGVAENNIVVIPNGADVQNEAPIPIQRSAIGVPNDVFLLVFAGDLQTTRKNLDTILKALTLLPDVHLAVAGEVRSSRYPNQCRQLDISDRVHFISFRKDDLPEVMAAGDAFVILSLYEPFGLVILEAMAAATAVVTARTVGASFLVKDAGVVLDDALDYKKLAEVIRALQNDRKGTALMGAKGRAIAQKQTWSQMATSYVDVYVALSGHG